MTRPSSCSVVFPRPRATNAAAAFFASQLHFSSFTSTSSHATSFRHARRSSSGLRLKLKKKGGNFKCSSIVDEGGRGIGKIAEDDDDGLCPVDCVREFKTDEEFTRILDRAKETGSLVVVDFYRTSCGSCKYIEQGFAKLCKGSSDREANVVFLKHNVIDEYDEQSEVADRLRIKAVPLFHFYKDGVLLEAFPTRDKERIVAAILKHTSVA